MVKKWYQISLLLCLFGFFRELRPSEPFTVEYFVTYKNITHDDIIRIIFPVGTFSYMFQLLIIFLITDILRYKPIIVVSAVLSSLLFATFFYFETLPGLLIPQILYGTLMSAEVAYYTYIYAKVERSKYQIVTGHTRSAILSGRFLASLIGQLALSFKWMSLEKLVIFSFIAQIISIFLSLLLPSVDTSIYFHKDQRNGIESIPKISLVMGELNLKEIRSHRKPQKSTKSNAFSLIRKHIRISYSNSDVLIWSIWWAVAMCGYLQVQVYIQVLYKEIDANIVDLYNGAVEAVITLLGAITAILAGYMDNNRLNQYNTLILTLCTIVEAVLLLWASQTHSLYACYFAYISFGTIYNFMITVASGNVAKQLEEDCFALIFGINTLLAITLQSTLSFIASTIFGMTARNQHVLYSCWFAALAAAYAIFGIFMRFHNSKRSLNLE